MAANWSSGVPNASVDALIVNAGTASVTLPGGACNNLTVGNSAANGTVDMTGGDLSETTAYVGYGNTGVFSHSGGTNTVGTLFVGPFAVFVNQPDNGSYLLGGAGELSAGTEWIGCYGKGAFTQTSGTHSVSTLRLGGYSTGAKATFDLSGSGVLSADSEYVGYSSGTATFTQSGGTNTAGYLEVHNSYTLSGGFLNINRGLAIRGPNDSATGGIFDFSGGTATVTASSSIIDFSGGAPQNTQNAALLIGANSLLIVPSGYDPTGHWATYRNDGIVVGSGATVTISAGQSVYGQGTIRGRVDCQGTLSASPGGSIILANGLTLTGSGVVNLGGGLGIDGFSAYSSVSGGSLTTQSVSIGYYSPSSQLTQSGGLVTTDTLTLGIRSSMNSGGNGEYRLSGSGALLAGNEIVGYGGYGTFTQTGGTNTVQTGLVLGRPYSFLGSTYYGYGSYTLNGGILVLCSLTAEGSSAFNFGGGTLRASGDFANVNYIPMSLTGTNGNANVDTAGHTVTLVALSGPGGLNKLGAGTLTLLDSNTYQGSTTVNGGKLAVDGVLTTSLISVQNGGTLAGSGTVGSVTVNPGGHLAPGNGLGVLALTGNLSLLQGALLDFDLGPPSLSDLLSMPSSTLTLGGQQFSDFTFLPEANFGPGTYTLIDAGTILGSLSPNTVGTIDGLPASLAVAGNDVVLTVTPEPSTFILLAVGASLLPLAYAWRKWRRIGHNSPLDNVTQQFMARREVL
jgi:autotransporter-associated beta strand protein